MAPPQARLRGHAGNKSCLAAAPSTKMLGTGLLWQFGISATMLSSHRPSTTRSAWPRTVSSRHHNILVRYAGSLLIDFFMGQNWLQNLAISK
eukprot:580782-Lingulodinium_polyedra.AAC.1